jgi:hypothetical protein
VAIAASKVGAIVLGPAPWAEITVLSMASGSESSGICMRTRWARAPSMRLGRIRRSSICTWAAAGNRPHQRRSVRLERRHSGEFLDVVPAIHQAPVRAIDEADRGACGDDIVDPFRATLDAELPIRRHVTLLRST